MKIASMLDDQGVSARFLVHIYEAFGIRRTQNLDLFTYGACDLSRIVDDCIDLPTTSTPATFDDLVEALNHGTIEDLDSRAGRAMTAASLRALAFVSWLDDDRLDMARRCYQDAIKVAQARTQARSIDQYIGVIAMEARLQCVVLNLSDDVEHSDRDKRRQYNAWLQRFTLGAYYVDAAVDLSHDHVDGRLSFSPRWHQRVRLVVVAMPHVMATIRATPTRSLLRLAALAVTYNVPALKKRYM